MQVEVACRVRWPDVGATQREMQPMMDTIIMIYRWRDTALYVESIIVHAARKATHCNATHRCRVLSRPRPPTLPPHCVCSRFRLCVGTLPACQAASVSTATATPPRFHLPRQSALGVPLDLDAGACVWHCALRPLSSLSCLCLTLCHSRLRAVNADGEGSAQF